MPTGRPDYWYGTALYFTGTPGDGETTRGPTADWAYDHVNDEDAHHDDFQAADAVTAMGAKADNNALNHDRYSEKDILIMELGQNDSGDRQCFLRMHAGDATEKTFYILRDPGDSGQVIWNDRGSGDNVFKLANVERFRIKNAGGVGGCWDDTPTNGETDKGVTSDWAYDHVNDADAHHALGDLYTDDGDDAAWDRDVGDFTASGGFIDWDISAIVGAKKCLVLLRVTLNNDTVGEYFGVRTNGNSNSVNMAIRYVTVANNLQAHEMLVETDASGVIEYIASNVGNWANIDVHVRGRFETVS